MTDRDITGDCGSPDQSLGEKRMGDKPATSTNPGNSGPKNRDAKVREAQHERGQAPTRADDDGMAQVIDKDELEDAQRDDGNLDEGLEDSMDASDPPSSTQP